MELNEIKELNIHQKIHAIMGELSYIQKEDKMVNGQYRFVSHDAVAAKCRVFMIKYRVISVPSVVEYKNENGITEATIKVDFINIDKPDDMITVYFFGFGIDKQDKGPGKAMSYAVKYAYLKVFCLETGDDPERDLIEPEKRDPHFINEDQIREINKLLKQKEIQSMDGFFQFAGAETVDTILDTEFDRVISGLKSKPDKVAK